MFSGVVTEGRVSGCLAECGGRSGWPGGMLCDRLEPTPGDLMKCGARVAIGVAGGYFLGRTKKMKLALMLGGMAAGRQAGGPGQLLGQGAKLLGSSPELAALRDQLTGRLVDAGKDAVMAVAARQIGSLTDRVSDRVESFADPERLNAVRPRRKGRRAAEDADDAEPEETDAEDEAVADTEAPDGEAADSEVDGDPDD